MKPRFPRPTVVYRVVYRCLACGWFRGHQSTMRSGLSATPAACPRCMATGNVHGTVTRYPARPGCRPGATILSAMRERRRRKPYLPFRPVVGGHITRPADPARKDAACPERPSPSTLPPATAAATN